MVEIGKFEIGEDGARLGIYPCDSGQLVVNMRWEYEEILTHELAIELRDLLNRTIKD